MRWCLPMIMLLAGLAIVSSRPADKLPLLDRRGRSLVSGFLGKGRTSSTATTAATTTTAAAAMTTTTTTTTTQTPVPPQLSTTKTTKVEGTSIDPLGKPENTSIGRSDWIDEEDEEPIKPHASNGTKEDTTTVMMDKKVTDSKDSTTEMGAKLEAVEELANKSKGDAGIKPDQKTTTEVKEEKAGVKTENKPEPESTVVATTEVGPVAQVEPKSTTKSEGKTEEKPKAEAEIKAKAEPMAEVKPKAESEPETKVEPKAEPEPEAKVEPKAEPEPEAKINPEVEAMPGAGIALETKGNLKSQANPNSKRETGTTDDAKAVTEPQAEPEEKSKVNPKTESVNVPAFKAEAEPKADPAAEPEVKPEAEPDVKPESQPEADPDAKPDVKPEKDIESKTMPIPIAKPEPNVESKPVTEAEPKPELQESKESFVDSKTESNTDHIKSQVGKTMEPNKETDVEVVPNANKMSEGGALTDKTKVEMGASLISEVQQKSENVVGEKDSNMKESQTKSAGETEVESEPTSLLEPGTLPEAEAGFDMEAEEDETQPESEMEEAVPESEMEEAEPESEMEETEPESEMEETEPEPEMEAKENETEPKREMESKEDETESKPEMESEEDEKQPNPKMEDTKEPKPKMEDKKESEPATEDKKDSKPEMEDKKSESESKEILGESEAEAEAEPETHTEPKPKAQNEHEPEEKTKHKSEAEAENESVAVTEVRSGLLKETNSTENKIKSTQEESKIKIESNPSGSSEENPKDEMTGIESQISEKVVNHDMMKNTSLETKNGRSDIHDENLDAILEMEKEYNKSVAHDVVHKDPNDVTDTPLDGISSNFNASIYLKNGDNTANEEDSITVVFDDEPRNHTEYKFPDIGEEPCNCNESEDIKAVLKSLDMNSAEFSSHEEDSHEHGKNYDSLEKHTISLETNEDSHDILKTKELKFKSLQNDEMVDNDDAALEESAELIIENPQINIETLTESGEILKELEEIMKEGREFLTNGDSLSIDIKEDEDGSGDITINSSSQKSLEMDHELTDNIKNNKSALSTKNELVTNKPNIEDGKEIKTEERDNPIASNNTIPINSKTEPILEEIKETGSSSSLGNRTEHTEVGTKDNQVSPEPLNNQNSSEMLTMRDLVSVSMTGLTHTTNIQDSKAETAPTNQQTSTPTNETVTNIDVPPEISVGSFISTNYVKIDVLDEAPKVDTDTKKEVNVTV